MRLEQNRRLKNDCEIAVARMMTATIVNGKTIAKEIRQQLAVEIQQLRKKHQTQPLVTTLTIGSNRSSELYMKLRNAACSEIGIIPKVIPFPSDTPEKTIIETIRRLNDDSSVHGIFIQYPVPPQISPNHLMQTVDASKDIEGFNPENLGRTLIGDEYLLPCTPLSVLTILKHQNIVLKGKDVVIVNHSNIVGKPLAALLLNRDATVSVCHMFTQNLKAYTSQADVLISGAGVQQLITAEHVKDKATVIDVGIIETTEGIRGDVDFESVKEKAGVLTPVPGGVGPVTIAASLSNIVKIFKNSLQ
jgi:methylenetetrahydrofolate dehydrogenase (NADP+)/methenyltetrahydrofolate cyclohydrolase